MRDEASKSIPTNARWMAPEVLLTGDEDKRVTSVDDGKRADVYSFAVLMFEVGLLGLYSQVRLYLTSVSHTRSCPVPAHFPGIVMRKLWTRSPQDCGLSGHIGMLRMGRSTSFGNRSKLVGVTTRKNDLPRPWCYKPWKHSAKGGPGDLRSHRNTLMTIHGITVRSASAGTNDGTDI